MGLMLLHVNLGAKGAGQTMFPLAPFVTTGIYCRSTVSHKYEVWTDTLGQGDREPFPKECEKLFQWVLMTTVHGLKVWRSRMSRELHIYVEVVSLDLERALSMFGRAWAGHCP